MTLQTSDTIVQKSIVVNASRERAYEVFTEGIDSWWPRSHHIGQADLSAQVIEPKVGGRCYGKHVDGSESDWGYVSAWEPPSRFVMVWQIGSTWQRDPQLVTEVEVTFTDEGGGRTRVDLEHRNLDRYGDARDEMRAGLGGEGGWGAIIELFKTAAES